MAVAMHHTYFPFGYANFRTRPATANGVAGVGYFSSFTVYSPPGDVSCLFTVLGHQLGRGFAAADDLCAALVA